MSFFLAAALFLQTASAPGTEVRTVRASIVDSKGSPMEGLTPQEVVVLENGVAREVTSIEKETSPMSLVLLVDNSSEISSDYRLYVVDAVAAFLRSLPQDSSFSVWATGSRPTKLRDFGDDGVAAVAALKKATLFDGGNTLLDALVEGTRDLKKREGTRTCVVVVTGTTANVSNRNEYASADEARANADLFLGLEFMEGSGQGDAEKAYGYVLDSLTRESGGILLRTLSPAGMRQELPKLSAYLSSFYKVQFATLSEVSDKHIEIQVDRPGAKVRVPSPPRSR